jgi:hypothetical protein
MKRPSPIRLTGLFDQAVRFTDLFTRMLSPAVNCWATINRPLSRTGPRTFWANPPAVELDALFELTPGLATVCHEVSTISRVETVWWY